ncbi:MAG: adenylate kinase [Anaeromyxobacter sp.]|nr:adenylate kinase [Anaeromyxobacter sp.]MBL0277673.1 adenylate kinase [Anaeromyxobacter sp.]
MILILLGPPGAGKGTQAKLLSARLSVPHVSTGDMFRDHKARATEIGIRVQAIMDSGGLVTDDITNAMVEERLGRADVASGCILDGYPRTVGQAGFLDGLLARLGRPLGRVVSYEVSESALVERIGGRRSCPSCGAVYHVTQQPPAVAGVCDRDGAALVHREDDKPENVRKRMSEYAVKTAPLKAFYQARGQVAEVGGLGAPDAILAATLTLLGR